MSLSGFADVNSFNNGLIKTDAFDGGNMIDTTQLMLTEVRKLALDIVSRAGEFEASGHLPLDLMEELKSIGIFPGLRSA